MWLLWRLTGSNDYLNEPRSSGRASRAACGQVRSNREDSERSQGFPPKSRSETHLHLPRIVVALAARQDARSTQVPNKRITLAPPLLAIASPPHSLRPVPFCFEAAQLGPARFTFLSLQLRAVSHSLSYCSAQAATLTPSQPCKYLESHLCAIQLF